MSVPTVEEVDRITRLDEPILRNLQITQCYYEISQSVAQLTGFSANWCTFATWASKQAGQTIRMEDLIRAFEERFYLSTEIAAILDELAGKLQNVGARLKTKISKEAMIEALNPGSAFVRASSAVARGNKKVFEEIGREFARFLAVFQGDNKFDAEKMARFCAAHAGARRQHGRAQSFHDRRKSFSRNPVGIRRSVPRFAPQGRHACVSAIGSDFHRYGRSGGNERSSPPTGHMGQTSTGPVLRW